MSEELTQTEETIEKDEEVEAVKEGKTFTEGEVNKIVQTRLAKLKSKYNGFDDFKEKATKFDELEEQFNSLKSENELLKHQSDVSTWKNEVAKETGVNANILRGDTKEEILEHANQIKELTAYPTIEAGKNQNAQGMNKSEYEGLLNSLDKLL